MPLTSPTRMLSMLLANEGSHSAQPARAMSIAAAAAGIGDYLALTKPRVMSLVVFTAAVGLVVAPGHLDSLTAVTTLLCIALGAGGAGALNMWYDADIDRLMSRTAERPIPRGRVTPGAALSFGLVTAAASVAALALITNLAAAFLLAFTIFFYVVIYTVWLKRSTPQSIVIGGASGAAPPAIAWFAASGELGVEPVVLFLIIFLWTPPHFWALAINRASDYSRAGIPALPVVSGEAETRRQVLIYSLLLVPVSLLPWLFGFAGALYAGVAIACDAVMVGLALRLRSAGPWQGKAANRLFAFSLCYLVFLFGALLIERIVTG